VRLAWPRSRTGTRGGAGAANAGGREPRTRGGRGGGVLYWVAKTFDQSTTTKSTRVSVDRLGIVIVS
jgi:hypothetical protein